MCSDKILTRALILKMQREERTGRENMLGGKRDTEEDTYQMKEISTSRIPDFDFF